jgi:hypothetical protein
MRFKSGQKVVCTATGNWYKTIAFDQLSFLDKIRLMFRGNKTVGPAFNDIVTVDFIKQNDGAIPLKEWRSTIYGQYQETCFEPLVEDGVLEAQLGEINSFATKVK